MNYTTDNVLHLYLVHVSGLWLLRLLIAVCEELFCMCVAGVISGVFGVGEVFYCVWLMCWLLDRGSRGTRPLSEEWLLTSDLAG